MSREPNFSPPCGRAAHRPGAAGHQPGSEAGPAWPHLSLVDARLPWPFPTRKAFTMSLGSLRLGSAAPALGEGLPPARSHLLAAAEPTDRADGAASPFPQRSARCHRPSCRLLSSSHHSHTSSILSPQAVFLGSLVCLIPSTGTLGCR